MRWWQWILVVCGLERHVRVVLIVEPHDVSVLIKYGEKDWIYQPLNALADGPYMVLGHALVTDASRLLVRLFRQKVSMRDCVYVRYVFDQTFVDLDVFESCLCSWMMCINQLGKQVWCHNDGVAIENCSLWQEHRGEFNDLSICCMSIAQHVWRSGEKA